MAELITHSITVIKQLLEALCLNMLFVIYYSLKEDKRSPSFLFKTKKISTRDTFVFMSITLIPKTISASKLTGKNDSRNPLKNKRRFSAFVGSIFYKKKRHFRTYNLTRFGLLLHFF